MKHLLPIAAMAAASCMSSSNSSESRTSLSVEILDTADEGRVRVTLANSNGMRVELTNLGATVTAVYAPDRGGSIADVTLGFDDLDGYLSSDNQYFGCTVGRVANRIAKGSFSLEGKSYSLAINNEPNHLHGGDVGWSAQLWSCESEGSGEVTFRLTSEDGDEGYPGRVEATARYFLTKENVLGFELSATSSAATPISLTNHCYWNLAGQGAPTVLDHELELRAEHYTPTDDTLIPTGVIAAVAGALDFRTPKAIGRDLDQLVETPAMGYDHNFVLFQGAPRRAESTEDRLAAGQYDARLHHPGSGRTLELYTDQPGLQFYSGNFLFGQAGKDGETYALRSACCLEPQGIPNAINEPSFPSVVLRPGETYRHLTMLRFDAE